jgi:hypothetical protein
LEVRETGDRRRGPWFFNRRHASDVSDRTRKIRMGIRTTARWAGAKRRRPATRALLRRPPHPLRAPRC